MNSICSTLNSKLEMVHRTNLSTKFETQLSLRIYNQLTVKYNMELLFFNDQLHNQMRNNLKRS